MPAQTHTYTEYNLQAWTQNYIPNITVIYLCYKAKGMPYQVVIY